jgi:hypothetical protein
MASLRNTPHRLRILIHSYQPFLLVLVVFLTFRLLLPFVFRNGSYFVEQAPDIGDYLRWGMLADSHLYPFINYWSEYPPLFAWSIIGLYRLSLLLPAWIDQRLWFSIIMQLVMTLFDLGSVILVYAIAQRFDLRSRATRAAALFAASFILAYGASGWYEPVPLFFLLLTLYLTLRDRYAWSAATAAIGLMTKIVPILIVPIAVQRLHGWRRRAGYLTLVVALSIGLLLPFVIAGKEYVLAFVRATLNRPSWLSIWALLDGNTTFGASVPVLDRFSPLNVGVPSTSVLPLPLVTLSFAVLFIVLYTRHIDWRDARQSTAFAGITVILFLLWSKGFSGQFTVYILPFVALLLPNMRGALYLTLLSVLWVAEWPLAFQMLDGQTWFLTWLIVVRTIVLIALSVEFAANLFSRVTRRAALMTRYILLFCWFTVPVVGVAAVNGYSQARVAADPATPAIDLVRVQKHDAAPLVFADTKLYRRLYAAAQPLGEALLLPGSKYVPEDVRVKWLNDLTARGPFWLIADEGDPDTREDNLKTEQWVIDHACPIDSASAGTGRVMRFATAPTGGTQVANTTFNGEIALNSYRLSPSAVKPGAALCVELNWEALKTPAEDYTVYIHVSDPEGKLIAQNDMQPRNGFAPTTQWKTGEKISDKHGLILPANLPAGEYNVRIGLYRSSDQTPAQPVAIDLTQISVAP